MLSCLLLAKFFSLLLRLLFTLLFSTFRTCLLLLLPVVLLHNGARIDHNGVDGRTATAAG